MATTPLSRLPLRPAYATKEEVLQAAKAIHDKTSASTTEHLQDMELRLGMRFTKTIADRFDQMLDGGFAKHLEGVLTKRLAEALDAQLVEHQKKLEEHYQKRQAEQDEIFLHRLGAMQKAYSDAIEGFKLFVQAIPPPQITVSPAVVQYTPPEMLPPVVNVNAVATAPVVNVQVPEAPPAQVSVNVPRPRLVEKSIIYDDHSRPVITREREVTEGN